MCIWEVNQWIDVLIFYLTQCTCVSRSKIKSRRNTFPDIFLIYQSGVEWQNMDFIYYPCCVPAGVHSSCFENINTVIHQSIGIPKIMPRILCQVSFGSESECKIFVCSLPVISVHRGHLERQTPLSAAGNRGEKSLPSADLSFMTKRGVNEWVLPCDSLSSAPSAPSSPALGIWIFSWGIYFKHWF